MSWYQKSIFEGFVVPLPVVPPVAAGMTGGPAAPLQQSSQHSGLFPQDPPTLHVIPVAPNVQ